MNAFQASSPCPLPPGQTQTGFSSPYVQIGHFVFNPALVIGFLHRPATAESTPCTEVLYEGHHVSVDDPNQALFSFLQQHTHPREGAMS